MNAKKCDRCGSFYVRKERKTDNAVDIFGKKVFNIILEHSRDGFEYRYCVDLCPKCMNDLKIFMEVQHVTPYIAKVEEDTKTEDPCHGCANPHCEQCIYGYKSLEERIRIAKENKEES
jgi:hypothetical protein